MLLSLSCLILLSLELKLGQALALARTAILAVYLASSVAYYSPLGEIHRRLLGAGFDPARDCLSGSGGDLTTVQAQASVLYRVISHRWRLAGNYSRALFPEDLAGIGKSCRAIFHIDTGETGVFDARAYCPNPEILFVEEPHPAFRPTVKLYACTPLADRRGS